MRVLILGNGAREHTVAWKFSRSRRLGGLFVAPGNAGTAEIATNLSDLDITDPDAVSRACAHRDIDFVFVGGEEPLAAGVVDRLEGDGLEAFGPTRDVARLESSKAFAKQFMERHGLATSTARTFTDYSAFENFVRENPGQHVLKKSGLAGGKGVLESDDPDELLGFGKEVLEDDTLIVEEYLSGFEVSVFALTDGRNYRVLPICSDYKKSGEGNTGRNTGGMGSLCPAPWVDSATWDQIEREIVAPTFEGLHEDGLGYRGVLYFGLMVDEEGPKILEFNVRFGDPETQAVLPLITADLGTVCEAIFQGDLPTVPLHISDQSSVAVVVASDGYPGPYRKGVPVHALPSSTGEETFLFHAATYRDNALVHTGGGRCFTAVGLGRDVLEARNRAYSLAKEIKFDGAWYRPDIGARVFEQ